MVGAVATLVDVERPAGRVALAPRLTAEGAMLGVAVGSAVAFLGNRRFAFRSSARALAPEALRFLAGTLAGMGVHAMLVRTLADRLGVPVVLAKLVSDVCVFTFGQLLLLRFFVFPVRRKPETGARAACAALRTCRESSLEAPNRPRGLNDGPGRPRRAGPGVRRRVTAGRDQQDRQRTGLELGVAAVLLHLPVRLDAEDPHALLLPHDGQLRALGGGFRSRHQEFEAGAMPAPGRVTGPGKTPGCTTPRPFLKWQSADAAMQTLQRRRFRTTPRRSGIPRGPAPAR